MYHEQHVSAVLLDWSISTLLLNIYKVEENLYLPAV